MPFFSMSKTILKNLFSKPATLPYPVEPKPVYERTRGHIDIDIDICVYCGICSKKCPTGAIQVSRSNSGWSIDRFKCIQCNCCVETCPKKCLVMDNRQANTATKIDTPERYENARVPNHDGDNKDS